MPKSCRVMRNKKSLLVFSAGGALIVLAALAQQAATEAPTGFDTPALVQNPGSQSASNGIAEPAGDTFATRPEDLRNRRRPRNQRPGPGVQRDLLRGMPSEPGHGRAQPDYGDSSRTQGRQRQLRESHDPHQRRRQHDFGALPGQRPCDLRTGAGACARGREYPRIAGGAEHARRRLRRGGGRQHAARDRAKPAATKRRLDPGRGDSGSHSGSSGDDASRPLRLEGPAWQHPFVRGGRLSERNGSHQPATPHGQYLRVQNHFRPRRCAGCNSAWRTSITSRSSSAAPRRRRATPRSPRRPTRRRVSSSSRALAAISAMWNR